MIIKVNFDDLIVSLHPIIILSFSMVYEEFGTIIWFNRIWFLTNLTEANNK